MITWVSGHTRFSSAVQSIPERPSRLISMRTTSGQIFGTSKSAVRPSPQAPAQQKPGARFSSLDKVRRRPGLSSTMPTLVGAASALRDASDCAPATSTDFCGFNIAEFEKDFVLTIYPNGVMVGPLLSGGARSAGG